MSAFLIDDDYDFNHASDDLSRYGAYLRDRERMFDNDGDEQGGRITTDPAAFTWSAWKIACSPIMAPAYVRPADPRVLTARCKLSEEDRSLIAEVTFATPRPAELCGLRDYTGWRRNKWSGRYAEPWDDELTRSGPAMLTLTRLLIPVPADRLHQPADAPARLTVSDAKAAVRALAAVLDGHVQPVLRALGRP